MSITWDPESFSIIKKNGDEMEEPDKHEGSRFSLKLQAEDFKLILNQFSNILRFKPDILNDLESNEDGFEGEVLKLD